MINLQDGSQTTDRRRRSSSIGSREKPILLDEEDTVSDARSERNDEPGTTNEKVPLLSGRSVIKPSTRTCSTHSPSFPMRSIRAIIASLKWVIKTLAAPGIYILSCFIDEEGRLSPLLPLRKLGKLMQRGKRQNYSEKDDLLETPYSEKPKRKNRLARLRHQESTSSIGSTASSSSTTSTDDGASLQASLLGVSGDGAPEAPQRRSIRIKMYQSETHQKNRDRDQNGHSSLFPTSESGSESIVITPSNLKSPILSSTPHKMTRYPRLPAPPHPLIPRRRPSYSSLSSPDSRFARKTLVLDLDETLIHSMAKGGRMSTGHMVEVKLSTMTVPGGHLIGPQHPILYNVHKRPHCDEFLRKMSNWYNLVIFTASVQEYADPVINWLEQERQYFSGRYYRQHCTYRNGIYIKDIAQVEPDLSKIMIVDNSPMSYIFHEGTLLRGLKEVDMDVAADEYI